MLRCVLMAAALAALTAGPAAAATQTGPAQAAPAPSAKAADDTLFRHLGGMDGITAVVDGWVTRMSSDARLGGRFQGADLPAMKKQLVDQLCALSGGPCTYGGPDMKAAHAGKGVTADEFRFTLEHLSAALRDRKVSSKDEGRVVGMLLPMKSSIVEKP